jgi:hypothetical protein
MFGAITSLLSVEAPESNSVTAEVVGSTSPSASKRAEATIPPSPWKLLADPVCERMRQAGLAKIDKTSKPFVKQTSPLDTI